MSSPKVINKMHAYIDGYNLYHGMMDRNYLIPGDRSEYPLRKYLWLDFHSFILSYFPKYYSLERIYYFTAPVRDNPGSLRRQVYYWKALESIPHLEIQKGKHIRIGDTYSEKQTDIKMALQMYSDALFADINCMVILSADSDQVPTIQRILKLGKEIEIRVIFPPCRGSGEIRDLIPESICHKTRYERLAAHQFPEVVSTQMRNPGQADQ